MKEGFTWTLKGGTRERESQSYIDFSISPWLINFALAVAGRDVKDT